MRLLFFTNIRLSDALVFIRRNLGNGISANDVIRHLGYSHTSVNNAFRRELGVSVQQEIIQQRRERACRLLKETNMTASDIASVCGHHTAQYFAHQFTQTFDTTPNAWRTTRQKRLRRAAEPKGDGP